MGGALTALAPDFTRAALGVPAMNYSLLLPRTVDFDSSRAVLYPHYPDELERPLILLADPDAVGPRRAERLRAPDDRRPAARHAAAPGADERRLRRSPGDQLRRRRRGADDRRLHPPAVLDPGRWPDVDVLWTSRAIKRYPFDGLGDRLLGHRPRPARPGQPRRDDRRGRRRRSRTSRTAPARTRTARRAARRRAEDDEAVPVPQGGAITDVCGAAPCYAGGWTGP